MWPSWALPAPSARRRWIIVRAAIPTAFAAAVLTWPGARRSKLFDLVREFRPQAAGLVVEPKQHSRRREILPVDLSGADCSRCAPCEAARPDDALCAIVGIAGLDAVLDGAGRVRAACCWPIRRRWSPAARLVMDRAARLGKPRCCRWTASIRPSSNACRPRADNPVGRLHPDRLGRRAARLAEGDKWQAATVRARAGPSHLAHGRQDHRGLRHDGEQGAGGHRGALAVRHAAGARSMWWCILRA